MREPLLPPASLARYADAIVRASLGIGKGDTLVVFGEPEHRELLVALTESGYRAGARFVDAVTTDPLAMRARLLHGGDDALGVLSPWARRRLREACAPYGALVQIAGEGEAGYLDGIPPDRIATDYAGVAKQLGFVRRAQLNMQAALGDRRLADRPLGRSGVSQARATEGEAPARPRPPSVLPPGGRGREGDERLDKAPAALSAAARRG